MEENRDRSEWQEISSLAGRIRLKLPEDYGKPSEETMALKFPLHIRVNVDGRNDEEFAYVYQMMQQNTRMILADALPFIPDFSGEKAILTAVAF